MMASGTITLSLTATIFTATLVRSATGFGFALLAVPMMSLVLEPASAVGLSLMFQIASGLLIALRGLTAPEITYALRLSAFTLIGLVPGLLVLLVLPPVFARVMLVACLLVALLLIAGKVSFKASPTTRHWMLIGLCAGFMQGVAGAAGPPVLTALHADKAISKASKRRIMSLYFVLVGLLSLPPILTHMPGQLLNLRLQSFLLVAMLCGIFAGHQVFIRLSDRHFHGATVLLLMTGLGLACYPLVSPLITGR
ncbi:sulfite exporter TauE/SafE family protein [Mangrovitalea sediminis]|uniref:sulfite exporter TauE/SafE family protein n=1 Tax=Mangrovitalea sediminis TaxID=1982043 RepID=UPI000BE52363|nr:sulfite exporter TauE/SafE family protein [Mangrovitalea sediminis]